MSRDPAQYDENSFTPDMAENCDSLEDRIAEIILKRWPKSDDGKMRPWLTKFILKVVHDLLGSGNKSLAVLDVRKIEGRDLLACLVAEIIDAPNARLMARCVDYVFELGVQQGLSETQMSALDGLQKATASHYCVTLKQTYRNGHPARGMKSEKAVQNYSQTRRGRSSRGPRQEWPFLHIFTQAYAAPN